MYPLRGEYIYNIKYIVSLCHYSCVHKGYIKNNEAERTRIRGTLSASLSFFETFCGEGKFSFLQEKKLLGSHSLLRFARSCVLRTRPPAPKSSGGIADPESRMPQARTIRVRESSSGSACKMRCFPGRNWRRFWGPNGRFWPPSYMYSRYLLPPALRSIRY